MSQTARQLFRSPSKSTGSDPRTSAAAKALLQKAFSARTCVELCGNAEVRRALHGELDNLLLAGQAGLTPSGIESAIRLVSTVTAAAQAGKYAPDDIDSVAARLARFPQGMRDDDGEQGSTEVEIVFASEHSAESPLGHRCGGRDD